MDINKLRFAELFKLERRAVKALTESLLEIHVKCKNPNGDGKKDCDTCAFFIPRMFTGDCAKLFLDDWLNALNK